MSVGKSQPRLVSAEQGGTAMRVKSLVLFAIFLGLTVLLTEPGYPQQAEEIAMNVNASQTVDATGNAHVKWVITFNPPRGYDRVKRSYPNLYVLFRDLGPERSNFEIQKDSLKISSDDGQRSITFLADVLGLAVSRKNVWQIQVGPDEQISTQEGNKVFTTSQFGNQSGLRMTVINAYTLPASATDVHFESETHQLTYTLATKYLSVAKPEVEVNVRYRKRLMAAVYKVYGDPQAQDGAYWVAKCIFKNTGKSPARDLRISYRLGEYSDMSVPDPYSLVPPGGTVVDRYYPVISSKVADLRTPTPIQLYIRYDYKDSAGHAYFGEITQRMEMLGINQFEFSNLNDEDRSDSWFDFFNNAPLLAAFVTRMDDPVKQFAGYISHAAGGAAASASKEDAVRWLAAAYEMEVRNDIVYSTPSGFLSKDSSSGQDIKYPRDVFRDKSGTCVDLAITYAALAEAVGLKANLLVVPGHTFAIIKLPDGSLFPVENTGLGGGNQRMSFEEAVKAGIKEVQEYTQGPYYLVNVEEQWNTHRIPNPELQQLGTDFLAKSGIRPLDQLGNGGGAYSASNSSRRNNSTGLAGAAMQSGVPFLVVHDHGIGTLQTFCVGTLYVSQDTITYEAGRANDGRKDRFQIKRSDIREVKKNRMPMANMQAFHIRMQNGVNFNFAVVDESGNGLSPDSVLMALSQ
jgi:hypothetical protein